MTDTLDRLKTALANRYAIEREIGAGGMPPCIWPKTSSTTAESVGAALSFAHEHGVVYRDRPETALRCLNLSEGTMRARGLSCCAC